MFLKTYDTGRDVWLIPVYCSTLKLEAAKYVLEYFLTLEFLGA